jgi:hypothetical protein
VAGFRQLSHAKDDVGDEFSAVDTVDFVYECRLEEGKLMQPYTVVNNEIEFFVANLVRPGIGCDRFPDNGDPVPAQAAFEHLRFEAQAASHPFEDARKRIDGTKSAHGDIIAKAAVAICSEFSVMLERSFLVYSGRWVGRTKFWN